MSDLFNPISRNPAGFTGPTLLTGIVPDPPRSLLELATGTILKGTVLGKGSDGLTTVATERGTVTLATNAQLPVGSAVMLEVRNAGDRLQVLILSVETSSGRGSPAHQSASGQAGGPASTGTPSSGAAAGTSDQAAAQPSPRPAAPPPIEIVGSSVKAIVVQVPAATSLLPTPDVDVEPFTAPSLPVSVPADAAQKAQLLAQARLLVQTPNAVAAPASTGVDPNAPAIVQPPGTGTPPPATTTPPAATPQPNLAALIESSLPQPGGTTLQPEVATRIAALFAAASGETASPLPGAPTAAIGVPTTTAGPLLAQLLVGNTAPAGPTPPPTNVPAQTLANGTELTLHVVAVLPSKGGEIEIAPEAARLTGAVAPLIGKVLGYTRAGHAVIDTPNGQLMMQERTRLPVGAQVALVLEPAVAPPAIALPPITSPQQALLYLSSGWPTLDDLLTVLRGTGAAPGDPASPVPPGIPQTGPKLAAGLATAINALRAGEIEKLVGAMLAARKLPSDKEEMVKRLKEEFTQLSDLAKDRPSVDWRALFLPVYDPRIGLTQINLYYRHNSGEGSDKDKKDQGTRFLVDVNFAALGAFQLDGLIRGKRFDLMIRSRSRLSRNQRQEIAAIFDNALEVGGGTGALEFRTVEVFPVSPLDELRQSHDHLTA
ncbi:hypothetical protein [Dongia sedimenti]|uniref:Flagellar hook-length control protein FliK n=1 Tax=Dongia sedimenti TaxID=3064282 RepID=A0ABU0YKK5_9PROT|nr:hypothetical protein [Rhodospirillaceae bacterium R-7]